MEFKSFKLRKSEVRDDGTFEGYLSTFNNIDSYGDVIRPGAFKKTISEQAVFPVLWQHDTYEPIGIFDELREDDYGLLVKGTLNRETQRGREAFALLRQGALNGLSIGFTTVKDAWDGDVRHIHEIKLWEGSLVTFPANDLARVTSVRSRQDFELALNAIVNTRASDITNHANRSLIETAIGRLSALLQEEPPEGTPPGAQEPPKCDWGALLQEIRTMRGEKGNGR
jgi:hypothetical protein